MSRLFQSIPELIKAHEEETNNKYSLETDKDSFVAGLEDYLAQRISNAMFSKQPEIKVVDSKGKANVEATNKLLDYLEEQDFYTNLIKLSQEVSKSGMGGILIQSDNKGNVFVIPVSSNHMFLPTFNQYGQMIELQLTRKMFAGAKPYFTQQHFTIKETKTLFGASATGVFNDYGTFNKTTALFSNQTFPSKVKNRLGQIPVILFPNKVYAPSFISDKPDLFFKTLATSYNGKALIPRLMQIWEQIGREIHRGRTMLISSDSAPDINKTQIEAKINTFNNTDFFNLLDGEDISYVGGNYQGVQELSREFREVLNAWMRQNFVSLNSNFAAKNNKNDLEVYQGSREEVQFIENRVAILQKAIRKAMKLLVHALSFNDKAFSKDQDIVVNIITNEVRDSFQETQKYLALQQAGLIDKNYAVKNALSISEKGAIDIVNKANAEAKALQESQATPKPKEPNND